MYDCLVVTAERHAGETDDDDSYDDDYDELIDVSKPGKAGTSLNSRRLFLFIYLFIYLIIVHSGLWS